MIVGGARFWVHSVRRYGCKQWNTIPFVHNLAEMRSHKVRNIQEAKNERAFPIILCSEARGVWSLPSARWTLWTMQSVWQSIVAAIPTLLSLTVTLSEIWLNYVAILGKWVLVIVTLGPSMQCATKNTTLCTNSPMSGQQITLWERTQFLLGSFYHCRRTMEHPA